MVRRGGNAWQYFYTVLGFALTIEGSIVSMINNTPFLEKVGIFVLWAAATAYLFLECNWFQNKLLGLKARYEEKFR